MSVTVPRSEIYAFGSDSVYTIWSEGVSIAVCSREPHQQMLQPRLTSLSRRSEAVGHLHCVEDEVEDQFQEFYDLNDQEKYFPTFFVHDIQILSSNTGWFLVDTVPGPALTSVERRANSSPNYYAVDVEQRSVGDLKQSR